LLIVFDLDDTLIDTSGCVTPFKLSQVVKLAAERGVLRESAVQVQQVLQQLNEKSLSSQDALESWLRGLGALHLLEEALVLYSAPLPDHFSIQTTPGAKKVLQVLQEKGHRLALVTGGKQTFQLEKLKKAGFELTLFSKIMIPEDSIKKPCYESLLREFSELPAQCVVVGDRIPMDLQPAHELGFRTVHMRWGRGLLWKGENWIDYSIRELSELLEIF